MAKKLAAFKTFCQEDQIALLKGGCTELMILRSVMTYDADKGCWKVRCSLLFLFLVASLFMQKPDKHVASLNIL